MEYARMPNIASSLPHFGEAFPSPSLQVYSRPQSPPTSYVAPLSASSLQAYNEMNASIMSKRKVRDFDILLQNEAESNHIPFHDPKRLYLERGLHVSGTRQRQESGCSIMSTSSWSSSASFSTVSSSSSAASSPTTTTLSPSSSPVTAALPDLTSSPTSRSLSSTSSSRSRSSSPPSDSDSEEYNNPLWHICDAIALAEMQDCNKATATTTNSSVRTQPSTTIYNKTRSDDGLKIVFLEPNWLAEHMAKSKKVAALKKQQQRQQQLQLRH
ncbi:hypothetical protein B0O80DRAFT_429470 [Mortierella sp. GBAus27b]|nr:hypothetical protein B0O80DRAFT_429470 [Mortierella sp. GBAus27b]